MMAVIKPGVPGRWEPTVMVRGLAEEEEATRWTSVPTALTPQLEKTTCQSTYVPTQERNPLSVHTVPIALQLNMLWINTLESTLEKSHTTALSVPTERLKSPLCSAIYWSIKHDCHGGNASHVLLIIILKISEVIYCLCLSVVVRYWRFSFKWRLSS